MQALLCVLALAATQEHGRRPLHERRRRPVRDKTARQQAAAARARAREGARRFSHTQGGCEAARLSL